MHKVKYANEPCSGIANGRVLATELYIHRNQKIIFFAHLFTNLFRKDISLFF